jgi:hypothetical protein
MIPATPPRCARVAARCVTSCVMFEADGVLFSTGPGQTPDGTAAFATEAQAHAKARPWRRQARAWIYATHLVADDRSDDRGAF